MLDAERPDFVDVCGWHGLPRRDDHRCTAARGPKAILSQKPMALRTLSDCDKMLTACQREGVKLIVGHQRRHLAGWLVAKQKLDEGIIGTPLQLTINSGALLYNVCMSHDVNMAQFLLGDRPWEWVTGVPSNGRHRSLRSGRSSARTPRWGLPQVEGGVQIVMGGALPTGGRGHGWLAHRRHRGHYGAARHPAAG